MKEFEFLETLAHTFNNKENFIGDDAVLIDKYLYTKDIIVENTHFLKTTPLEYVIHKLFTSNISDISAMGGTPLYCLLGIAVDSNESLEYIIPLVKKECDYYNIHLIGGDTTFSKSGLFFSLTVIGIKNKNVIYRHGAESGDIIFLSRPCGLNKISLEKELGQNNFNINKYMHYNTYPEHKLGELLGNIEGVTSLTDISDGLSTDLINILESSNKKGVLEYEKLPLSHLYDYNINHLDYFLSSGEEYSLLFTVEKESASYVKEIVKTTLEKEIYEIGYIEEGSGLYLKENSNFKKLDNTGYEHFK